MKCQSSGFAFVWKLIKRLWFLFWLLLRTTIQDPREKRVSKGKNMWSITWFKAYSRLKALIYNTRLVNCFTSVVAPTIHMLWRWVDASGTKSDLFIFLAPPHRSSFQSCQGFRNQKENKSSSLLPVSQARCDLIGPSRWWLLIPFDVFQHATEYDNWVWYSVTANENPAIKAPATMPGHLISALHSDWAWPEMLGEHRFSNKMYETRCFHTLLML